MRHLPILLLAACALILGPDVGWAQSTPHTFKGRTFDLPTPTGFCIPNSGNSNEAQFVKTITALMTNSEDTVIKVAAECDELAKRGRGEAGSNIYDYIVYYYPTASENESLQGNTQSQRKASCDDLRKLGDASVSDVPKIVAKTAEQLNSNMAVNSVKMLGVLAEDAHGCYVGLLSTVSSGSNSFIMNVNVLATVIHGKSLWVALYSKYQNPSESQKSLLLEQAIAADLDSRNPD